ncbi:MAG: hypothetical protein Q8862_00695 [Bacteroidota bacterium]|nr:hypothetical protein [Bacteroidota bacterium]
MKKIFILFLFVGSLLTSCIKANLDELPVYNLTGITSFNLEYKFEVKNENNVSYVSEVNIPCDVTIDNQNSIITVIPTMPSTNSEFTAEEQAKVTLKKLIGYCSLETAASIAPIGNAPKMGALGDWSVDNKYKVIAADGKTTREWTVKVIPFEE